MQACFTAAACTLWRAASMPGSPALWDPDGGVGPNFISGTAYARFAEVILGQEPFSSGEPAHVLGHCLDNIEALGARTAADMTGHEATVPALMAGDLTAHYALACAMLRVAAARQLSVAQVVSALRRVCVVDERKDPFDLEDAMLLWTNKIVGVVNGMVALANGTTCPQIVPPARELLAALADGRHLGLVLAYYSPRLLSLTDLQLDLPQEDGGALRKAIDNNLRRVLAVCDKLQCPCPLLAVDFIRASLLTLPAALYWISELFLRLEASAPSPEHRLNQAPRLTAAAHHAVKSRPHSPLRRPTTAKPASAHLSSSRAKVNLPAIKPAPDHNHSSTVPCSPTSEEHLSALDQWTRSPSPTASPFCNAVIAVYPLVTAPPVLLSSGTTHPLPRPTSQKGGNPSHPTRFRPQRPRSADGTARFQTQEAPLLMIATATVDQEKPSLGLVGRHATSAPYQPDAAVGTTTQRLVDKLRTSLSNTVPASRPNAAAQNLQVSQKVDNVLNRQPQDVDVCPDSTPHAHTEMFGISAEQALDCILLEGTPPPTELLWVSKWAPPASERQTPDLSASYTVMPSYDRSDDLHPSSGHSSSHASADSPEPVWVHFNDPVVAQLLFELNSQRKQIEARRQAVLYQHVKQRQLWGQSILPKVLVGETPAEETTPNLQHGVNLQPHSPSEAVPGIKSHLEDMPLVVPHHQQPQVVPKPPPRPQLDSPAAHLPPETQEDFDEKQAFGFVVGEAVSESNALKQRERLRLFQQRQKQREQDLQRARAVRETQDQAKRTPVYQQPQQPQQPPRPLGPAQSQENHPSKSILAQASVPPKAVASVAFAASPTQLSCVPELVHQVTIQSSRPADATPALPPDDLKVHSNKQLIKNAILRNCLAGQVNEVAQRDVLEALENSEASHYIVLLRDINDRKFRALYAYDLALDEGRKLAGRGPTALNSQHVAHFFRYSSASRNFDPMQTASIGLRIDAVTLRTRKKKAVSTPNRPN